MPGAPRTSLSSSRLLLSRLPMSKHMCLSPKLWISRGRVRPPLLIQGLWTQLCPASRDQHRRPGLPYHRPLGVQKPQNMCPPTNMTRWQTASSRIFQIYHTCFAKSFSTTRIPVYHLMNARLVLISCNLDKRFLFSVKCMVLALWSALWVESVYRSAFPVRTQGHATLSLFQFYHPHPVMNRGMSGGSELSRSASSTHFSLMFARTNLSATRFCICNP